MTKDKYKYIENLFRNYKRNNGKENNTCGNGCGYGQPIWRTKTD